ncbi:DUF4160 domain-containing protein [candidate division KSB1 bacterium]|nr:DUF4160 domain-containing protein [candidate division KSB1 bacterium]
MPVILRHKGYQFFFFSNEGNPLERVHIHVRKGDKTAKFWLYPIVSLAGAFGLKSNELAELEKFILLNRDFIERKWNEYFRG